MKSEKLYEKSYAILKEKMIAVPKGNPFSVFHYASSEIVEKMSSSVMNLYCSLSATKDKDLDLKKKGPARIFILKKRKDIENFTMIKEGVFNFYMQMDDNNKVLTRNYTYDKVIKALSQDLYLTYREKFADSSSNEDEKQREFLLYLSDVDAVEIIKTTKDTPLTYSNEGGFVKRMERSSFYETYKAILYSFSYRDEELKNSVYKKLTAVKRNGQETLSKPEQTKIIFEH